MNIRRNQGFTLLEMMISVTIFTVVMGALYGMSLTLSRTHQVQDAGFQATQEVRRAVSKLVPQLQQASRQTITITNGGTAFTYRVPVDTNGNGYAVDNNGNMEISGLRTVSINNRRQLILTNENGAVTVLASNINPGTEFGTGANGDWIAPPAGTPLGTVAGDDDNGNGRQDLGFGITRFGSRFRVHIGTLVQWGGGADATVVSDISQMITPRNP